MKILLFCAFVVVGSNVHAQSVAAAPNAWSVQDTAVDKEALGRLMLESEHSIVLEKYDLISIHIYGAEALSFRGRISPEGSVDIPLAGPVALAGLTSDEARQEIAGLVRERGLVLMPAVTLEVLESPSRVVTVSGQVKNPGVYPVFGNSQLTSSGAILSSGVRTLSQALSVAGGLRDTASGIVTLIRPSHGRPIPIPLGTDPNRQVYASLPIFGGDEIVIANVGQAFVIGAVKKQGAIALKNYSPTTVASALAMSDGIGFEAAENDARLVRTEGDHRIVLKVQARKIVEGKAPDIALQNDDILYIPTVQGKAALKGGAAGLIVSLASTYIYAHP